MKTLPQQGGFLQVYEDSSDPRFSNIQRAGRATVAVVGSSGTGLTVGIVVGLACGTTPAGLGVGVVGGVGAAFGFDEILKPRVFQRFGLDPGDSLIPYNP